MRSTASTTVITPPSRWAFVDFREVWQYRELLGRFTRRDLTLRYRQTALGVIWVIIQPLLAAGIFGFVFGRVAGLTSEGVPYFVFAYAGTLGWGLFSGTITRSSNSLVGNANLVSKIYFPRIVIPASAIGALLVDFGIGFMLFIVIALLNDVAMTPALALLPFWMVLCLALALGPGLIAASLGVRFRDVMHILPVATQMLLYASPVAYSVEAVPESVQWVVRINPLTGMLEGFRWSLLGTDPPAWGMVGWSAGVAVALLLAGLVVFARMERRFADVI